MAECDITICVHNCLHHLVGCVESVRANTLYTDYRLIVVNDGSDRVTTEYISSLKGVTVLNNKKSIGYLKSANRGLSFSRSRYKVLLNSDTIVTPGWLTKLARAAGSGPNVGLVSPLSNSAQTLTIRMPPGLDFTRVNELIEKLSLKNYPPAVTVVGFCLLVTQELIDAIGLFDEAFGMGYVEECDYQYRAADAGFSAVIADDTYIYHVEGASRRGYDWPLKENLKLFMSRWEKQYEKDMDEYGRRDDLGYLRNKDTMELAAAAPREERDLDVLFVLMQMGTYGGVIDIVEIVNRLILKGVRASVATFSPPTLKMETLFEPIVYESLSDFRGSPPRAKLVVATSHHTVYPIYSAYMNEKDIRLAYYIQDYESWFEGSSREGAVLTYPLIDNRITISTWLHDKLLSGHGHESVMIPLGVDRNLFYPRGGAARKTARVAAMVRVEPRRGMENLFNALRMLSARRKVKVDLFGTAWVDPAKVHFSYVHHGVLSREETALLLSRAAVVIDPSAFHGFGLIGLEAMASGVPSVLTDCGGIREYARDGINALLVPPGDPDALARNVMRLMDDGDLRRKIVKNGLETAARFDWDIQADRIREYFSGLLEGPPTPIGEKAARFGRLSINLTDWLIAELGRQRQQAGRLRGELDYILSRPAVRYGLRAKRLLRRLTGNMRRK